MANQLSMDTINDIYTLHKNRYSARKIYRDLGVDRGTVSKYLARLVVQNQPNAPTGAEVVDDHPPTEPDWLSAGARHSGPQSACEPFREEIRAKLEQGLQAQRIYQDLVADHFHDDPKKGPSYYSVRCFITQLVKRAPMPFRRMETAAGEEAQVDFGTGAPVRMSNGKTRRPWIFRIVLSHSRKAYSEAVWHQSTECFIQCLENAFRYFGGSVRRLVIDNLKAAVMPPRGARSLVVIPPAGRFS